MEDLSQLDRNISNAQHDLANLQSDSAEASARCEKYKSESSHYYRGTQAQISKNNDLIKMVSQAEVTLRTRMGQVEQGNKEVAAMGSHNSLIQQSNEGLREDIEACRKHLENLALQNNDVSMCLCSW